MSTTTAPAPVKSTTTPKVVAPNWAALKSAYQAAERSGNTARSKAYDTIARAFALTSETENGKAGTVARSDRSRAGEVIDALNIASGNVFGLSAMRIAQVVKVYGATARAGRDPFAKEGREIFTALDTIRKNDADALNKAADAFKGATPETESDVLAKAVADAKEASKARKAGKASTDTTKVVENLAAVTAFAEAALPMVRKVSATASPEEKAAARKALEAILAHLK